MSDLKQQIPSLESALKNYLYAQTQLLRGFEEFKEAMRDFKKESNKRWGDLANRLGTLVVDIVVPNLPNVLSKTFGLGEPIGVMSNIKRKNRERCVSGEVDALIEYDDVIFVNETKSTLHSDHIERFAQFMGERFQMLFPEYGKKKADPVISSIAIPDELVSELTEKGILGVVLLGDILTVVNQGDIRMRYGFDG